MRVGLRVICTRLQTAYNWLTTDSLPSGKVGKIVVRVLPSRSPGPRMPRLLKPLIIVVVLAAGVAGSGVGEAEARTFSRCSAALIHDWYVDGRIDRTYPVRCYREALRDIPEDQIVYGTLRDDLTRALAAVISSNPNANGDTPVPPGVASSGGGGDDGSGGSGSGGDDGFFGWLANTLGPDTADSVPVPLLVLAGLALALMAAAGISFVARRVQAKRGQPPPTGQGL